MGERGRGRGKGEREKGRREEKREMRGEGERNIDFLFHLFKYSSVDSCMRPDRGSNPQP